MMSNSVQKMKSWTPWLTLIAFFAIALLPGIAMAQSQFTFAPESYFINVILKGILGDIINPAAASATGTVTGPGTLGEVFKTFNIGVAFFGSVIVVFITLVGVIQSGNDGEFLGRKWSSTWVPVRFAAGSALMLPLTTSGYSYCQALVLWVASQGIGFADTLWSTIANRIGMKDGMELTQQMDLTSVTRAIALNSICAAGINKVNEDAALASGSAAPADLQWNFKDDAADGIVGIRFSWARPNATGVQSNASCGSISYSVKSDLSRLEDPYTLFRDKVSDEHIRQISAISQKYKIKAEEIAEAYAAQASAGSDPAPSLNELAAMVKADATAYNNSMAQIVTLGLNESGYKIRNAPGSSDMTKYGFAMAGMWYMELVKVHNTARHAMTAPTPALADLSSMKSEPGIANFGTIYTASLSALKSEISNNATGIDTAVSTSPSGTGSGKITTRSSNFSIDTEMLIKKGFIDGFMSSAMNYVREAVFGVGANSNNTASTIWSFGNVNNRDPDVSAILQLKDKGDTILNMAGILMALDVSSALVNGTGDAADDSVLVSVGSNVLDVVTLGASAVGKVAAAVIGKLSAYMLGAITSLFILGVTLSVFIPMIPYVLWVGALLGLCVLIVEALVAIMLWAVMMMHPSGEGITSDYNRQGLNMLLAVFMRPALLLMGLILGMFMVEPMVMFVNDTFSIVMSSVQANTITGIFSTIAFIAIYVSLILMIVEKSFGMIHVVPDRVLTWIGGPGALTGEERSSVDKGQAMMSGAGRTAGAIMLGRGLNGKPQGKTPAPNAQATKDAAARYAAAKNVAV